MFEYEFEIPISEKELDEIITEEDLEIACLINIQSSSFNINDFDYIS